MHSYSYSRSAESGSPSFGRRKERIANLEEDVRAAHIQLQYMYVYSRTIVWDRRGKGAESASRVDLAYCEENAAAISSSVCELTIS